MSWLVWLFSSALILSDQFAHVFVRLFSRLYIIFFSVGLHKMIDLSMIDISSVNNSFLSNLEHEWRNVSLIQTMTCFHNEPMKIHLRARAC